MTPGRNDPCPCGSGRKYKHCCGKADSSANPLLRLLPADVPVQGMASVAARVVRAEPWEVDLAPVAMFIESDPAARPAALVIRTGDLLLRCDMIAHPPAEVEEVAALLADAIGALIAEGAAPPSLVRVRHSAVARALRSPLRALGVRMVNDDVRLTTLYDFLAELRTRMTGLARDFGALAQPATWAGWAFDPDIQSTILDAAAAFHDAQPWMALSDSEIIKIDDGSELPWYACVMGNAGETYGLAMYQELMDIATLLDGDVEAAIMGQAGPVISLLYNARNELTPEMGRELARTKRYTSTLHAWPSLMTRNTIGGGISRAHALDLAHALDSIPRFVAWLKAHEGKDVKGGLVWTDEVTGNTHTLLDVSLGGRPSLWSLTDRPTRSLPQGENADPRARAGPDTAAACMQEDLARLERYLAAERAAGAPAKRMADDQEAVSLLVNMSNFHSGATLRAFNERDLRVFLYDLFPRKVMGARSMSRSLRSSLRRFFAWMEDNEGVSYPWAAAVLRDRQAFDERLRSFPGGHWWDGDVGAWMGELFDDMGERLMDPDSTLEGVGEWGAPMGPQEAELRMQLGSEWMLWREELIQSGVSDWDDLADALSERQRKWETTPQAALKGKSPAAVVKRERLKRGR